MIRVVLMIAALLGLAGAAHAQAPRLERVVLVMRHGVRPPTMPNAAIAKYAAQPWPDWPVAPGELTPHGGETVRLMGETLHARYAGGGLLPASGCAPDDVCLGTAFAFSSLRLLSLSLLGLSLMVCRFRLLRCHSWSFLCRVLSFQNKVVHLACHDPTLFGSTVSSFLMNGRGP